jgi:hypothetical protein
LVTFPLNMLHTSKLRCVSWPFIEGNL